MKRHANPPTTRAKLLLIRACKESGIDHAEAFAVGPNGSYDKSFGRPTMRSMVWKKLKEYGLTWGEISTITDADHSSIITSAKKHGWYVPTFVRYVPDEAVKA